MKMMTVSLGVTHVGAYHRTVNSHFYLFVGLTINCFFQPCNTESTSFDRDQRRSWGGWIGRIPRHSTRTDGGRGWISRARGRGRGLRKWAILNSWQDFFCLNWMAIVLNIKGEVFFIDPKLREVSKGNFHRKNQLKGSKIDQLRTKWHPTCLGNPISASELLGECTNSVIRATGGIHRFCCWIPPVTLMIELVDSPRRSNMVQY